VAVTTRPGRGPHRDEPAGPGSRRIGTGRVLGILGLVELALTGIGLLVGWLSPDFSGFAVSVGISLLFLGDFLRRGQAVLLTLLGMPVGFALGQGYVLWLGRGDAERLDALVGGSVGALVGLLFGYVATGMMETRRRADQG
jgi:hypothetical protein